MEILKMQQLFKIVLLFMKIILIKSNAKTINGIFEGRLNRARNMAIASNIAGAINGHNFHKPKDGSINRSHVFVSPREVNVLLNSSQ